MADRASPARRVQAPASDSEPATYIGDFVREKEIGKGSFATVYLAYHRVRRPTDPVALRKWLWDHFILIAYQKKKSYAAVKAVSQNKLTRKLKENLESEIRILKSLQHPHIVALFSCTETPAYIYLVMEYCQLSDLAQFMKKRTQLPDLPETADIFRKYPNAPNGGLHEVITRHFVKQIASALEYLRARNLIHRDIKPQNLLLNPSPVFMHRQKPEAVPLAASEHSLVPAVGVDSLPMLKIADFGFARHLPQQMLAETLCGSPLYMAPEILGYKKYDAKADLWSVGAVTFEMMVGKPPFRASNHIELLRKIDLANDVIKFPDGLVITSDMKRMIRSLLKREPTERVSFEGFFKASAVTAPIPGLVGEDVARPPAAPKPDPGISELSRRMQKQAIDNPAQDRPARTTSAALAEATQDSVVPSPPTKQPPRRTSDNDLGRRPSAELVSRKTSTGHAARPMDINRPSSRDDARRPPLIAHATAPPREFVTRQGAAAMERRSSRQGPAPVASAPREDAPMEQARPRRADQATREARERTAQDLAFEREYVMIEKRAVEVNAFADELAASPHLYSSNQGTSGTQGAMVRRVTSQGTPTSSTGTQAPVPSTAIQTATGRRPAETLHARQASFERRYAPNPASATNMLSKALNMANARLFGVLGQSPPLGAGPSPPRGYTAFPSYPSPANTLAITDGKEITGALDEDVKILKTIEEAATRSDTVYSFAEVKYRQLLPATPSTEDGAGIRQLNVMEKHLQGSEEGDDQDLTQVAVVAVSEEALVLFVKALAILAKSIDLAGLWWNQHHRGELTPESSPSRSAETRAGTAEVGKKMNGVVQWARNRFNECLEKSEIVGRRLVEAQKQLPQDHPGHPNNRENASDTGSGGNAFAMSATQIQLTSGVTAEKLMFDRAVEMSRAAAVNELVGDDLKGCEISYRTAIILLEAVLEGDDEPLMPRPSANKDKAAEEVVNGMATEDRKTVITLIEGARSRLRMLVQKIREQRAALERRSSAPKGALRGPSSPSGVPGTSPR